MIEQDGTLNLFTGFHLNLSFSAVEKEQRPIIVENCYWPLLNLAEKFDLPFGIEAPGYTLEEINRIDPEWISKLHELVTNGQCEFIGSGWAQLIGPLVPAEINKKNLEIGGETYNKLIGTDPEIALINEQAYAAGLVELYDNADYKAIFTEWDNPYSRHDEWNERWKYYPQRAVGPDGNSVPVLWNNSIAFQKFQRYVHREISLESYIEFLESHIGPEPRVFCVYGNDVEVFDFRPGRYDTEPDLNEGVEWDRIEQLFEYLSNGDQFNIISPTEALSFLDAPNGGKSLSLESSADPIVVKKQHKYNLTRWAVTGRNDLDINTRCWRLYDSLSSQEDITDSQWQDLCYFWGSDFRTHITEQRWSQYLEQLSVFESEIYDSTKQYSKTLEAPREQDMPEEATRDGDILTLETEDCLLQLNCRRGLAIDALWFDKQKEHPLCGTLRHGYFDDIGFGADWYTGHTVFETAGQPKVTDLNRVEPKIWKANGDLIVRGNVPTRKGPITKIIRLPENKQTVELTYDFDWGEIPIGSLRFGNITLHPERFNLSSLKYRTHNGGRTKENFSLGTNGFNHGDPVSFLVSGRAGVGLTEGIFDFVDNKNGLQISIDKERSALIGMVKHQLVNSHYFTRLSLSAIEMDETSKNNSHENLDICAKICLSPI